jgi:VIT1/CCC1 family predicted Fe2+/Mn2+ transporter
MRFGSQEIHHTERFAWLRAAVLGANDGILSTSSLVLGVATTQGTHHNIPVAGTAGLVAKAMSMAGGEYVSVHSQSDTEKAELARERTELKADSRGEHKELAGIYVGRGLDPALAKQVAQQLVAHDELVLVPEMNLVSQVPLVHVLCRPHWLQRPVSPLVY